MSWGFKKQSDAIALRDAIPYLDRLLPENSQGLPPGLLRPPSVYIAKVIATITARSSITPGKGTVAVYKLNDDENIEAVEYLGAGETPIEPLTYTVYNMSTTSFAVDSYVLITRDVYGTFFTLTAAGGGSVISVTWDDPELYYTDGTGNHTIDIAENCAGGGSSFGAF